MSDKLQFVADLIDFSFFRWEKGRGRGAKLGGLILKPPLPDHLPKERESGTN
jgi:hypothetical protein